MHPIFRPIFQRQLRAFREMQIDGRVPEWERGDLIENARRSMFVVEDALDAAASAVGPDYTLRPDAMLLLAINLQQLAALPLMLAALDKEAWNELISTPREVEQTTREDAVMIARAAKEQARERGDERELSAADIVRGLANVLEDLHLKDWRLWDRLEQPPAST